MNGFVDARSTRPSADELAAVGAPRGIAENASPWIAGFFGLLTALLYRETLRIMEVARSLNW
jgi:hypothetical protein